MGIGTLEVHSDRPDQRVRRDRQRRRADAADDRSSRSRTRTARPSGRDRRRSRRRASRSCSPQAAYIMTDILAGNTDPKINPFWGEWAIYGRRQRRPAAYKTGTTNDNRDVHAYGFLAPPKDPKAPAARGRRLDGQQRQRTRTTDTLSLEIVGAAVVGGSSTEVSRGTPIVDFKQPAGLVDAKIDAFSGMQPGPFTTQDGQRAASSRAPSPTRRRRPPRRRRRSTQRHGASCGRTAASGRGRRSAPSTSARSRRTARPGSKPTTAGSRAPRGPGVRRRAEGHPDGVLLRRRRSRPFGQSWGGAVRAERSSCPTGPPPTRAAVQQAALGPVRRGRPVAGRSSTPPAARPARRRGRQPDAEADAANGPRRAARRSYSLTIVAPSPPSPRSPGRTVARRADGSPAWLGPRRAGRPSRGRG